jgi:hypothetical protein
VFKEKAIFAFSAICKLTALLMFSFTQGFSSESIDHVSEISPNPRRPLLEVKSGYFFFSDAKMRKIYNQGGIDVQISGAVAVWEWLEIYGSIEYLTRHGKSSNFSQKTSIWEMPISLGLKPVFPICATVQYYFSIGPRYCFVHQHNHSSFVDKNISHNGVGGFVNTGFHFLPYQHLLIDIFGEYSFIQVRCHPSKTNVQGRSMQIGGFAFGAGIGYVF